ncbi:MAG TPA: hypothetical protein ENG50_00310 [Candidatus Altiarchaeales archaeon]|nr:hypothetical protein [Candidatus Altiarchaeales archaeon]
MSGVEINIEKEEGKELLLSFKEVFEIKIPEGDVSVSILKEDMWKEKEGENLFYKEVQEKTLPELVKEYLWAIKIDAYTYEEHPLKPKYFLCVKSQNAREAVKKAIENIRKDINSFREKIEKRK